MGDYERARQSFIASVHVDEAYMAAQQIRPEEDWNYAHNLAYLIAACAEAGRYQEGLEWAAKLRGMPAPTGMTSSQFVIWAGGSVARLRIRFSDWKAVESETIEFGTSADKASPAAKGLCRRTAPLRAGAWPPSNTARRGPASSAVRSARSHALAAGGVQAPRRRMMKTRTRIKTRTQKPK